MSDAADDPRCPECGGPIGQTATYCMHCSADLTGDRSAGDQRSGDRPTGDHRTGDQQRGGTDGDRGWDERGATPVDQVTDSIATGDGQLLDPDGIVDNTLTVVVGIIGGIVVGIIGTSVLLALTGSGWAVAVGFIAWLGSTAYLVRRRTVQGAISKSAYAVAVVLLSMPVVAFSPVFGVEGGMTERGGIFAALIFLVVVPAGFAAVVGWIAGRFVPDESDHAGR